MEEQHLDPDILLEVPKMPKHVKLPIAELLEISGNAHTYQKRVLGIFIFVQFFYGFIYSMIPYLYFTPSFLCLSLEGSAYPCNETEACGNKYGFSTTSERDSLVTRFELYCDKKYLDTYGKNFIFGFAAIGCFLITAYSDYRGRKIIYLLSCMTLIGGGLLGMANDYITVVVGMSLCFLAMELFLTFAYIYTNEIVGTSLRSRSAPIIQLSIGFGIITSNVGSLFNRGYYISFLPCCFFNGLLTALYCYLVESPYFLDKSRNKRPVYECLNVINRINHCHNEQLMEQKKASLKQIILRDTKAIADNPNNEVDEIGDSQIRIPASQDKKMKSTQAIIMVFQVCVICSNIAIVFGLVMIAVQHVGTQNIQFNSFAFTLTIPVAVLYAIKKAPKLKRRKSIILQNVSIIVLSFMLIVLRKSGLYQYFGGQVLDVVLCVCIMAGSALINALLSTYISELFPTDLRGLALGADVFISRLSYIASSYLALLSEAYKLNPMSFCFIPAVMSLIAVVGLKETMNPKGHVAN